MRGLDGHPLGCGRFLLAAICRTLHDTDPEGTTTERRRREGAESEGPALHIPDFLKDTQFIPPAGLSPEDAIAGITHG